MTYDTLFPADIAAQAGTSAAVRDGSLRDKIVKIRFLIPFIVRSSIPNLVFPTPSSDYYTEEERNNLLDSVGSIFAGIPSRARLFKQFSYSFLPPETNLGVLKYELENNSRLGEVDEAIRRLFYGSNITDSYYYPRYKFFGSTITISYTKRGINDVGLGQFLSNLYFNFSKLNPDMPEFSLDADNKDKVVNPLYAPAGKDPLPIEGIRKFLISNPAITWISNENYEYYKNNLTNLYFFRRRSKSFIWTDSQRSESFI